MLLNSSSHFAFLLESLQVGDLEGVYPTSNCFSRYPLRELVLATALAWWGDSVTGVKADYDIPATLSTPTYKPLLQRSKHIKVSLERLITVLIHT